MEWHPVVAKMAPKVDREIGRRISTQLTNGECSSGPVVGRCSLACEATVLKSRRGED
jgi:hypothetical protein